MLQAINRWDSVNQNYDFIVFAPQKSYALIVTEWEQAA